MGILEDMQKASMFFTGGAGAPATGASAQDMRRKIALAMLMKKNAAPKTFGEGLSALGDAWGDRSMAARLEAETAAQAAAENTIIKGMNPTVPPASTGPRAEAVVPLADQVAEAADSPAPNALAANPLPTGATASAAPVAGFRPPPDYLAPHLAASGLPPERQAYLGHLAGKEARSANEVSPTGAAGPFQFIRSTGRQYGLMGPDGDRRTDPVASIAAVNRLTDDNAAVLTKALGQPPSPGELALAHQQGAGTAAKMLNGTGNAPAYNLAVNNAGGLGGQAAANKIMGYYGMPGSRDSIAAAALTANTPMTPGDRAQEANLSDVTGMRRAPPSFGATASLGGRTGDVQSDAPPVTGALQGPLGASVGDTVQARQDTLAPPPQQPPQQPPGPQLAQAGVFPPVQSAGGQVAPVLPGGGLPPQIAPQISQAPPDPRSAIRAAPPPEYKPRRRPQPEPPEAPGAGPIELEYTQKYINADVPDRVKAAAAQHIAAEKARRAIPYNNKMKRYEADIADWKEEQKQERSYDMTLPKQAADVDQSRASTDKVRHELSDMQEKSVLQSRFGGRDPDKAFTDFDKEKESAAKTVHAVSQYATVRDMIGKGIIVGTGQGLKVSAAKVAAAFGYQNAADAVSHTEQLQAALTSTLGQAIDTIQGAGQKVSDSDLKVAQGTTGGDPTLQLKTIKEITERAEKISRGRLNEYEDQRDYYFGGTRAERRYQLPTPETAPQPYIDTLLKNKGDDAIKAEFDQRFGPGAADLEIARAKRRERRGG